MFEGLNTLPPPADKYDSIPRSVQNSDIDAKRIEKTTQDSDCDYIYFYNSGRVVAWVKPGECSVVKKGNDWGIEQPRGGAADPIFHPLSKMTTFISYYKKTA